MAETTAVKRSAGVRALVAILASLTVLGVLMVRPGIVHAAAPELAFATWTGTGYSNCEYGCSFFDTSTACEATYTATSSGEPQVIPCQVTISASSAPTANVCPGGVSIGDASLNGTLTYSDAINSLTFSLAQLAPPTIGLGTPVISEFSGSEPSNLYQAIGTVSGYPCGQGGRSATAGSIRAQAQARGYTFNCSYSDGVPTSSGSYSVAVAGACHGVTGGPATGSLTIDSALWTCSAFPLGVFVGDGCVMEPKPAIPANGTYAPTISAGGTAFFKDAQGNELVLDFECTATYTDPTGAAQATMLGGSCFGIPSPVPVP